MPRLLPAPLRSLIRHSIAAAALAATAMAAPGDLPNADEAAVARRILQRTGFTLVENTPASWAVSSMRTELADLGLDVRELRSHSVASKDKSQLTLAFFYGPDNRVLAIRGNGPWLNNDSLADLKALPELRLISVDHNGAVGTGPKGDFDGSGLAALADTKLVEVKLGLSFSDRGIAAAAQNKKLRTLHVIHSQSTEAGIDALAGHPALTEFVIAEMANKRVTPAALAKVARIPKLTKLGFRECYLTYDGGLEHLKPLAGQLTDIDLGMCLVSAADLERLKKDHPKAKVTTMTPEQIAKTHKGVAQSLAKQAPPELAAPLKAALGQ